ncbi:hypothetical protein [Enterococcus olivae]
MNNLVIMKDKQAVTIQTQKNGEKFIKINDKHFDYIDLLEFVCKASYTSDDLNTLLATIDLARDIAPTDKVGFLQQSVREIVLRNFDSKTFTEFDIHNLAKEKISSFISGCEVINHKNHPKHIPDMWVRIGRKEIPVEIKLRDFNLKARNQLERYMDFYGCEKGIAIGKRATTKLPENILFISIAELEESK